MTEVLDTIRSLFERNQKISAVSIGGAILTIVVLMGFFSLMMLNDKSTMGYKLNKLEELREELVKDGEITDMLTLRARSMTMLEESDVVRYMSKPERSDITYVTPVVVVAQR